VGVITPHAPLSLLPYDLLDKEFDLGATNALVETVAILAFLKYKSSIFVRIYSHITIIQ
jgi:hypothetical protein